MADVLCWADPVLDGIGGERYFYTVKVGRRVFGSLCNEMVEGVAVKAELAEILQPKMGGPSWVAGKGVLSEPPKNGFGKFRLIGSAWQDVQKREFLATLRDR